MDKLKNFIDANRDAFEEDEMLPEGHFERFEQKLPKPRKNRAALYSLSAFAIAASIALLLLFRLPGGTGLPEPAQKTTAQTCETQEEIEELRLYYNMQMNDVLAQMKKLYKQDRKRRSYCKRANGSSRIIICSRKRYSLPCLVPTTVFSP